MKLTTETNEILNEEIQSLNSTLNQESVRFAFRGHYVNVSNDSHGIKHLITEILKNNNAILPRYDKSVSPKLRKVYLVEGMTSEEIINHVRVRFGFDRYSDKVIQMYIARYMFNEGTVDCVQMTGQEDSTRTCKRPRAKYYLVKK
jgi:hypothetical protein